MDGDAVKNQVVTNKFVGAQSTRPGQAPLSLVGYGLPVHFRCSIFPRTPYSAEISFVMSKGSSQGLCGASRNSGESSKKTISWKIFSLR